MLSAHFGADVRIACREGFPYSRVSRCTLEVGGDTIPHSVIVRILRDDPARSGLARLHNEQAALNFLDSISCDLAPRFIASDTVSRILITEDLGRHPSLLDLLLGNDREAAYQGLLGFARSLGTLHAQTADYASAYHERRAELGPADPNAEHPGFPVSLQEGWRHVQDVVGQLGLPDPRGVERDSEEVARVLLRRDQCWSLSSGDPSLVNCKVANGAVRFFDFEDAGFRHALLDATVLRYPYPAGGPVWRLPKEVSDAIEQAYREAVFPGCPIALDDCAYEAGMAVASAAWTILRMARLAKVEAGPDRDSWPLVPPGWSRPIPMRSRRRQLVAIIETCIASAHRAGTLEAFADWCESMVSALRERWPEATEEIALYPAFDWPAR